MTAIITVSCEKAERKETIYGDIQPSVAEIESFEINQVLKPIDITIGDRYLCILNDERGFGEQIFVYDADNLEFKYKFARRGSGPHETLATDMVKNIVGDTLHLIDQAKYKMMTYHLKDNGAEFIKETSLMVPSTGPLQEVYMLNDSVFMFSTLNGEIMTYSMSGEEIIDSFDVSTLINGVEAGDRNLTDFHYSPVGNNVYITFRKYDNIVNCILNNDYTIDASDCVIIDNTIHKESKMYDQYIYNTYIYAGRDYVLSQYYGYPLLYMQPAPRNLNGQNLEFDLILMDRNLKPLVRFQPKTDILRCFLDESRRRIYFLEIFEDFDKLKYISF